LSTAAQPPEAAAEPAAPQRQAEQPPARSWRERLKSPTLREIMIAVAAPLIGGLILFVVHEAWGALHRPAPTGSITRAPNTMDAFVGRADFYRRYVHAPAPPPAVTAMGVVFGVQTEAHHSSSCRFAYTVRNLNTGQTVGDLVDQPVADVGGGRGCGGEKRLWIPWPCVPTDTRVQFELELFAGSKPVDAKPTESFLIGGGC
jgi:hypothetical protein